MLKLLDPWRLLTGSAWAMGALCVLVAYFVTTTLVAIVLWYQLAVYLTFGNMQPFLRDAVELAAHLPGVVGQLSGVLGSFLPSPTPGARALGDTSFGFGSNTFCELYVEVRDHLGNQGVSAAAAADRMAALGLLHTGPPPPSGHVLVYFGPSADNEFAGHVGVVDDGGTTFYSVTAYGLQQYPLAGWRAPYLGWVDPTQIASDRFGNAVHPVAA